jgi:mannosyltransferase OCH1-like enzyme
MNDDFSIKYPDFAQGNVSVDYESILKTTRNFIDEQLMPIINELDVPLEGNLFMYNLKKEYFNEFIVKQKNLILMANQENVIDVLEIGFNGGFSTLLLLNSNPNVKLTCIDIGMHSYVVPCFNKIKEFYGDRIALHICDSVEMMPKLTKLYDLIHIDGGHTYDVAKEDIINSYYISKPNALLIINDYDMPQINNLCNELGSLFNFEHVDFEIFSNPYQSVKKLNKYSFFDKKYLQDIAIESKQIPKIVHQIAPIDKSKWHPIWEECQTTWLQNFPSGEYEYRLWNDEDDLEKLIQEEFPFFIETFKSYPFKIQRIDMARYFILLKYGGMYADMDFYCYKNFYETLDQSKPSIAESPWIEHEFLQNSLMASPPGYNHLFLNIIDEAIRRNNNKSVDESNPAFYISNTTGPSLASNVYYRLKSFGNALEKSRYNPIGCQSLDNIDLYNENTCYCKHFGTGKWE